MSLQASIYAVYRTIGGYLGGQARNKGDSWLWPDLPWVLGQCLRMLNKVEKLESSLLPRLSDDWIQGTQLP